MVVLKGSQEENHYFGGPLKKGHTHMSLLGLVRVDLCIALCEKIAACYLSTRRLGYHDVHEDLAHNHRVICGANRLCLPAFMVLSVFAMFSAQLG